MVAQCKRSQNSRKYRPYFVIPIIVVDLSLSSRYMVTNEDLSFKQVLQDSVTSGSRLLQIIYTSLKASSFLYLLQMESSGNKNRLQRRNSSKQLIPSTFYFSKPITRKVKVLESNPNMSLVSTNTKWLNVFFYFYRSRGYGPQVHNLT